MVRESLIEELKSVGFVGQETELGVWHYTINKYLGLDITILVSIHYKGLVLVGVPGDGRQKLYIPPGVNDEGASAAIEEYCLDIWRGFYEIPF